MPTKKWSAKNKINSTTWDKNDICDFTQCEVKQKKSLHHQEEYQTVVDKKLITYLGKSLSNQKLPQQWNN